MTRLARLLTTILLLGGCERSDSAQAEEVPTWSLNQVPEISKRGVQVEEDSIFFFRVLDGAFAGDGDIVISLGSGDHRVIYLDREGELAAALGRVGAGPGEVRTPLQLFATGDAVALWDSGNRRIALFRDRAFIADHTFRAPTGHRVLGVLDETTVVTTWAPNPLGSLDPALFDGFPLAGEPKAYYFWSADRDTPEILIAGVELADASFNLRSEYEGRIVGVGLGAQRCLPRLHYSLRADTIIVADSQEDVVYTLNRDGVRTDVYRSTESAIITKEIYDSASAAIERLGESARGRVIEESKRLALERLGKVGDPFPAAWSDLILEDEGRFWLQRASCFSPRDQEARWLVIHRDGTMVAEVTLPGHLRLLDVKNGAVLGVETDPLGVESVVVYRLSKS